MEWYLDDIEEECELHEIVECECEGRDRKKYSEMEVDDLMLHLFYRYGLYVGMIEIENENMVSNENKDKFYSMYDKAWLEVYEIEKQIFKKVKAAK